MASNQPAYRKAGRGGAGNFFPQIGDAVTVSKDLEAQKSSEPVTVDPSDSPAGTFTGRLGIGGAGNYITDPTQLAAAQRAEKEGLDSEAAALSARFHRQQEQGTGSRPSQGQIRGGGRGGAGNWGQINDAEEEKRERESEKEREFEKRMDRRAEQEVELGLKIPQKAMYGRDKTKPTA